MFPHQIVSITLSFKEEISIGKYGKSMSPSCFMTIIPTDLFLNFIVVDSNNIKALLEFSRISVVIIVIFKVSLPKAVKVVFIGMMGW